MWISKFFFKETLKELEIRFDNKYIALESRLQGLPQRLYELEEEFKRLYHRHRKLQKNYDELLKYFNIEQVELPASFVTRHKEA
jgi:predicted nuclease with TOPRIM domain